MPRDFNRDWALRLAEAGMAVFPCGPDKKPLIKWRTLSSSDPEAVAQMWSAHPGALPAIDLAKCDLFVLDGDRHGGPDGRSALRSLLKQHGFKQSTAPTALTPGDGVHVYFGQNGHELTNARGDLPPGVDARGWGGYVVAPYAVLADGRRYKSVARCAGSHCGIQGRLDPARAAGRGRSDPGAKAKRQQGGQRPGYRNQQHPREQLRARRAGRLQRRAGRGRARPTQRDAECPCLPARPHGRARLDRARRGRGRADRGHRRQTATSRTTVRMRSPQRCDPASMPA